MFSNLSLVGLLLLLQLTVPVNAFVLPAYKEGGLGVNSFSRETSTSLMMAKRILCSFDSTDNGEVLSNPIYSNQTMSYTNVLRLHMLAGGSLDIDKHIGIGTDQVCLYVNGVGGDSNTNKIVRGIETALANLNEQLKPMTDKLQGVYEKGDKIYVTGFSRGSASARQFVANLEKDGLKCNLSGEKVEKPPVEFLGCFDTVSLQLWKNLPSSLAELATGKIISSDCVGEKHGKLPSIVKTAVHNLALDDGRFKKQTSDLKFILKHPNIWNVAPFPPTFMDSKDERVHEVWFPGIHEDVGGSKPEHGLSDCSGVYMQEWLANEGITFYDTPEEIPKENFIIPKKVNGSEKITAVTPGDIVMKPDPSSRDYHDDDTQRTDPRPVVTVHNNKKYKGTVRVHETVLEHLKQYDKYNINPEIMNTDNYADLLVVGSLDKVDEEKTKEFKETLQKIEKETVTRSA